MFGSLGVILDGSKCPTGQYRNIHGQCVTSGMTVHMTSAPTAASVHIDSPASIRRTTIKKLVVDLMGMSDSEIRQRVGTLTPTALTELIDYFEKGITSQNVDSKAELDKAVSIVFILKSIKRQEQIKSGGVPSSISTKTLLLGGAGLVAAWFFFIRK